MNNHVRSMCLAIVLLLCASNSGAVDFDWAEIGNASNLADNTGYGSVDYEYNIAKTEVTNAQYIEFLNAVAKTDTYGLYNTNMNDTPLGGITRGGTSGNYTYSLKDGDTNWSNKPVVYVDWYDTLRFSNWLQNGQPTGSQNSTTTEDGVYDMSLGASVVRKADAVFFLPNENEWYKAAYYSPEGIYYDYATGTDTQPNNNAPGNDTGNSANYYLGHEAIGSPYYSNDVGAYSLSVSPYGTYDQNGNVWEWNETLIGSSSRGLRGGSWYGLAVALPASNRYDQFDPSYMDFNGGFRVASYTGNDIIPEPLSIGLLVLSMGSLLFRRANKA